MDKLGVINMALLKTGLPLASSLKDCDWNAAFIFDLCVEQIERGFAWGFAQKFTVCARDATAPPFGFDYSYTLPADCLRVIDVRNQHDLRAPKCTYVLQGRKLLTSASPCNLRYVARNLEPGDWPGDFTDAVACLIACEIAALSAEKMSLVPVLTQKYQLALAQAQIADARENTERVPLNQSLFAARQGQEG